LKREKKVLRNPIEINLKKNENKMEYKNKIFFVDGPNSDIRIQR